MTKPGKNTEVSQRRYRVIFAAKRVHLLEKAKMTNTLAFVRKLAGIKPTARNKGVEMTIKVIRYDNGMININSHGFTPTTGMINASRLIMQMLEELDEQAKQRSSKGKQG